MNIKLVKQEDDILLQYASVVINCGKKLIID